MEEIKRYIIRLKHRGWRKKAKLLNRSLAGKIIHTYETLPYLVVALSSEEANSIRGEDGLVEIFEDGLATTQEQQVPWGVSVIKGSKGATQSGIRGEGVRVGILDTGIDLNHPDLRVAGGITFVGNSFQDDNGHGTHVAGIIAAQDNDQGVVGVAPGVELFAIKALNSAGNGWYSDIAAGLEWAVKNKLDIINLSLGGNQDNALLRAAVKKAANAGILLVAAAGNSGNEEGSGDTVLFPAKYPEVIAVAAIDRQWQRAAFSSTGPQVELAAPGVEILSTNLWGGYRTMSGTSMATPHITGLAALLKSALPQLTAPELRRRLGEGVIDLGPKGRDSWYGYGLPTGGLVLPQTQPDNTPPQLYLMGLPPGEPVSGEVNLEILAFDPSRIKEVQLLIDQIPVAKWTTAPYRYAWDTRKVPVGEHQLTVYALDGMGNLGELRQIVKVVPTVTILEPPAGTVARHQVRVRAVFSPNAVIEGAEFYVDGIKREEARVTANEVEFSWDSGEVSQSGLSVHTLKIIGITATGMTGTGSVQVKVRNPVVQIYAPAAGSVLGGDTVDVFVQASDQEGIERVEMFWDEELIGSIAGGTQPYRFALSLKEKRAGSHILKAIAYTPGGRRAISPAVKVQKGVEILWLSPIPGTRIWGKKEVKVRFGEPVSRAELLVNDQRLGIRYPNGTGPVSWTLDAAAYPDLTVLVLKVLALAAEERIISSMIVPLTVDSQA
ncbi:S8 family serine peptidase [Carboxydocella sp. JDF658]|uniref:S8 family serine peptidase n=1 Tax=Carboxydocella sp. JDF658 TaxID=1926600 RepID=UPI0009AD3C70|nr:S8 family serine peptidase [Carboxydocella sp. JDF658]GAW30603.1 peptidase S8 [Carboxydocella sp. JDF658]